MITSPVTILDNFLDNPQGIREWGLSLDYTQSPIGNYPGKRTECISKLHPAFFNYLNKKILSLFFSTEPDTWHSSMYFHLSKDLEKTGWIHQDPNQITSIIYLSPEDINVNRGTSLYELKHDKIHPYNSHKESTLNQYMPSHYLTGKISEDTYNLKNDWENSTFNKILDIQDKFNRLVCFDPNVFHANNNILSENSPDRLTLITFIDKVAHPSNFPIPRSKQILSM